MGVANLKKTGNSGIPDIAPRPGDIGRNKIHAGDFITLDCERDAQTAHAAALVKNFMTWLQVQFFFKKGDNAAQPFLAGPDQMLFGEVVIKKIFAPVFALCAGHITAQSFVAGDWRSRPSSGPAPSRLF